MIESIILSIPNFELLEKLNNKRRELKYLNHFRKRNQKRFYD